MQREDAVRRSENHIDALRNELEAARDVYYADRQNTASFDAYARALKSFTKFVLGQVLTVISN